MSSFYVPTESLLQSRAFRRLLMWSMAGHVIVFLALVVRPLFNRSDLISPSPVMVQLVAMPKAPASPKPAPEAAKPPPEPPKEAPKPPEPPPPAKPVVKEIVIPKEPAPLPAKPKPVPKPVDKTPPPSAEELLSKMTQRVEAEEAAKAPPDAPAAESPVAATATAGRFDPLLSPWVAQVKVRVNSNWTGATVCTTAALFDVDVSADGRVNDVKLTQSSGDANCDATAWRAITKSSPLPPPPQAATYELNMDPKDLKR